MLHALRHLHPEVRPGTTRIAFLVGPWAVKVPRLHPAGHGLLWGAAHGILANLSERRTSRTGARGIAPVLLSLAGIVQVYPRCVPVWYTAWDYSVIADPHVPVDPRPHNVGMLDDELVFLDYAAFGECVACGRFAHETGIAGA